MATAAKSKKLLKKMEAWLRSLLPQYAYHDEMVKELVAHFERLQVQKENSAALEAFLDGLRKGNDETLEAQLKAIVEQIQASGLSVTQYIAQKPEELNALIESMLSAPEVSDSSPRSMLTSALRGLDELTQDASFMELAQQVHSTLEALAQIQTEQAAAAKPMIAEQPAMATHATAATPSAPPAKPSTPREQQLLDDLQKHRAALSAHKSYSIALQHFQTLANLGGSCYQLSDPTHMMLLSACRFGLHDLLHGSSQGTFANLAMNLHGTRLKHGVTTPAQVDFASFLAR